MGKNRLFIPLEIMDQWVIDNQGEVDDQELTLANGRRFHLAPAVLFLRESTGAEDPYDLVGRVKEEAKLTILGADAYMDSVLLEDNAYDVTRGFAAVPAVDTGQVDAIVDLDAVADLDATLLDDDEAPSPPPPPPPSPPPEERTGDEPAGEDPEDDNSDELAELLLKALK